MSDLAQRLRALATKDVAYADGTTAGEWYCAEDVGTGIHQVVADNPVHGPLVAEKLHAADANHIAQHGPLEMLRRADLLTRAADRISEVESRLERADLKCQNLDEQLVDLLKKHEVATYELSAARGALRESFQLAFQLGAPPHCTLTEAMQIIIEAPRREIERLTARLAEKENG